MTFTPEQIANGKTWIAALRSGDYRQGRYALISEDTEGVKYCCLGVARHLFDIPKSEPWAEILDIIHAITMLGISSDDQERLAEQNDGGVNFEEIADSLSDFYGLTENAA